MKRLKLLAARAACDITEQADTITLKLEENQSELLF
jgi:hypothetical protein